MRILVLLSCLLTFSTFAQAGYPPDTTSPNGQLEISLPSTSDKEPRNKVIEHTSKRTVAIIEAAPGYDKPLNYNEVIPPNWAPDSSLLLWKVAGKWFPTAFVLIKFHDNNQLWQLNVLKASQNEILKRTKKAQPKKFTTAKAANLGNSSDFPEGFTINVNTQELSKIVALPLKVRVSLTSNPKQIPKFPTLESSMTATITKDGDFVDDSFQCPAPKNPAGD